jgi:hypothetical protein
MPGSVDGLGLHSEVLELAPRVADFLLVAVGRGGPWHVGNIDV